MPSVEAGEGGKRGERWIGMGVLGRKSYQRQGRIVASVLKSVVRSRPIRFKMGLELLDMVTVQSVYLINRSGYRSRFKQI